MDWLEAGCERPSVREHAEEGRRMPATTASRPPTLMRTVRSAPGTSASRSFLDYLPPRP